MTVKKIVITGGPCGGKSTALQWIKEAFSALGYTVLFVPETATELITGGVAPWTCNRNADFQKLLLSLQLHKETLFEKAAASMLGEKFLIVCDRGALDNKAYMTDAEYAEVLTAIGKEEEALCLHYDAIFHLVTAAKGAERFYTTANNSARIETVAEAAALDDKIASAWQGHPRLCIIDNATDFEGKMNRLIAAIASFLGETLS